MWVIYRFFFFFKLLCARHWDKAGDAKIATELSLGSTQSGFSGIFSHPEHSLLLKEGLEWTLTNVSSNPLLVSL